MPDTPGLSPNVADPNSGGINRSQPGGVQGQGGAANMPTVQDPAQVDPGGPLDPGEPDVVANAPGRTNPPEDVDYSKQQGDMDPRGDGTGTQVKPAG